MLCEVAETGRKWQGNVDFPSYVIGMRQVARVFGELAESEIFQYFAAFEDWIGNGTGRYG